MAPRNPRTLLLARFLLAAAFVVFVFLVAHSPARIIYDERYFIRDIALLHEQGFTPTFIHSLRGAVGPLYALVHAGFEPLTHLDPIGMRLANVFLFVVLFAVLVFSFRLFDTVDPWIAAGSVMVVPMAWILAGIALSEMPAMVFVSLGLFCQLRALACVDTKRACHLWFVASALCLGIAVWGRQPYLLLSGIPLLLALRDRRLWPIALVYVCIVLMFIVPLFVIWGGLTPPSSAFFKQAISLENGIVSLGYIGICLLLLEPTVGWPHRKFLAGLFAAIFALNATFSLLVVRPLRPIVGRLPEISLWVYDRLCGAVTLTLGIATLLFICRVIWDNRDDLRRVSIGSGLLCLSVWPMLQSNEYSSRYTAMSLPYLLLMGEPMRKWNLGTLAAAAIGCGLGASSLLSYYK